MSKTTRFPGRILALWLFYLTAQGIGDSQWVMTPMARLLPQEYQGSPENNSYTPYCFNAHWMLGAR
jgi:hypothetical protein